MDNSAFTAKVQALNVICNGVLELARKHTVDRKTETIGGRWRPFEYPHDLVCFHCIFGKPAEDSAKSHPFWNELWQYMEQYDVDVANFRARLVSDMVYGCDTGISVGTSKFWSIVHETLLDAGFMRKT